jgi:hypothetical protein
MQVPVINENAIGNKFSAIFNKFFLGSVVRHPETHTARRQNYPNGNYYSNY